MEPPVSILPSLNLPVTGSPEALLVLLEVAEEERFLLDHDFRDAAEDVEDFLLRRFRSAHSDDVPQGADVAAPDTTSGDAEADDAAETGGDHLLVVEVVMAGLHIPNLEKFGVQLFLVLERSSENLS
jgi:hypothetical protein